MTKQGLSLEERRVRARRRQRGRRVAGWVLVAAGGVLLACLPWLIVEGPYWFEDSVDRNEAGSGRGGATLVAGLRTALVAWVAAFGAGIALFYTARNFRLTRRGQVTERFTKALERLGSEQMYVRIGGILALEQITQDDPGQATHAAQVLGHFIRDRAPGAIPAAWRREVDLPARPAPDVLDALTALTHSASRNHTNPHQVLDLSSLHLAGANLVAADLASAYLIGTDLTRAMLTRADLTHAILDKADLTHAVLWKADLTHASLVEADLTRAHLVQTGLTRAVLWGADLTGARLDGADLTGAVLFGANLTGARLDGADLSEARMLTVEQVAAAVRDDATRLPGEIEEELRRHAE